jgi:hypothetical protein
MSISEPWELDGVSVGASELSIISGTTSLQSNTTAGVYQLMVDPVGAAMAKSDEFAIRIYEKVEATGGTKRCLWKCILANAQSQPIVFPPLMLMNGFDFTIQKIAGTDRNWDASVRAAGGTVSQAYEIDGVTVGGTAISVVTGTTTPATDTGGGIYQLFVDPVGAAMAKGDDYLVQVREKVEGTRGSQRVVVEFRLMDAQSCLVASPQLVLINGWDMTIKKIAGTDRSFDATIRKVA